MTPPSDCALCAAMNRRESAIYRKFKQSFPGEIGLVYRRGEIRGLHWLAKLGNALYQSQHAEAGAAHAH
jgi:hypothetical protein